MHNTLLGCFTAGLGIATLSSGLYFDDSIQIIPGMVFLGHGFSCFFRPKPPALLDLESSITAAPKPAGDAACKPKPRLSKRPRRKGLFVG